MKNPILIPELRDLLKTNNYEILKSFLDDHHEKEIAEYLGLLNPDEIWKILSFVNSYKRAEIFCYLDMDVQVNMVSGRHKRDITELLMQMSHDDRADLFQHLKSNVADKLLVLLPLKERIDVINLTSYKAETAGAIMTTDYTTLNETVTVGNAIIKIRMEAPSKETIYYIYVTNNLGKLIGFVSLRRIILADPDQKIKELMKSDVIFTHVDDDQEVAASVIEEYDLLALPVVDYKNRLLGIITYDDAIDIIREEQTEDLEKLMAIRGGVEEKSYLDIGAYVHFKKRVLWVIILGVLGLVSGMIISGFKDILKSLIILTFYMPLLNSAGGNTGSQSATVVLRAITLKELFPEDFFRVIKKEFSIGLMLCVCLGVMTYLRVLLFSNNQDIPSQFTLGTIAFLISIALSIQVIGSTVFGSVIPIIAIKLKLDPAVISSPALTTVVDMAGITIYFTTAKLVLGI